VIDRSTAPARRRPARRTRAATTVVSGLARLGLAGLGTAVLLTPAAAMAASPAPAASGPSAAAAALPAGAASVRALGITGVVRDLLVTGDRVWVSTGNEVDVFSTSGQALTSITGILGAQDLIASPDGRSVYVAAAQAARIATLDIATMSETASWSTGTCPTHLALAGGRLFYAAGCSPDWNGTVASIDPADGSAGPELAEKFYNAPILAGAGDTLVVSVRGLSPASAATYTVGADGTLAPKASAQLDYDGATTISPDAQYVLRTGGYNTLNRYLASDLSPAGTFAVTGWAGDVAYSADGTRLAGGAAGDQEVVRVFDASSGSLTSHSVATASSSGYQPQITAGTLQFSADGSTLYGLSQPYGQGASLVTATAGPVSASKISATVSSATAYGKKSTVRITGRAGAKVSVKITQADGVVGTRSATLSSQGTASVAFAARYSGSVIVSQPGDLRHAATTSAPRAYSTPAALTLTAQGYYSTKSGLKHYHKASSVRILTRNRTAHAITISSAFQVYYQGKWRTVNTFGGTLSPEGAYLVVRSTPKHYHYRFVVSGSSDRYNSKPKTVTSPTFVID
jgi:hypothetical protein